MISNDLWRWRMNVSRGMGNTRDPMYTDDLIRAFEEKFCDTNTGFPQRRESRDCGPGLLRNYKSNW